MNLGGWEPPSGWHVENHEWLAGCVVIGCADYGFATIDMKNRIFCVGICRPTTWNSACVESRFEGRGWRRQIMKAAEEFLRSVADEKP